ncbi:MAG: VanZ family protein [Microscillaceae bacterium]|jgi:VanZ family protein|nr:VanZ family protein [Microscillaceae bacterium]
MFFKYNFYTLVWAAVMFALNWGRGESLPHLTLLGGIGFDKFAHFAQFCILSFLMLVGFYKQNTYAILRFNGVRITLICCLLYTLLLEGIQFWRLRPYFEWGDLLADWVGCGGGMLIFYFIYKFRQEN